MEKSSYWDIAPFAAAMYVGGLLALNFLSVLFFLIKIDLVRLSINKYHGGLLVVLMGGVSLLHYDQKRRQRLLNKFESDKGVDKGIKSILFWSYLIFTVLTMILVALYRPGYLGNVDNG